MYERLRQRVREAKIARHAAAIQELDIMQQIAPCYYELHQDIASGAHSTYHLSGGRGSCKSSFISLEMVHGIMQDPEANGIVFRRVAGTMRDSVYSQIAWAISTLGVLDKWRGSVSPMAFVYIPTGQQILFRGLDDPLKIKSIKPRRGVFRYVWFEELAELPGANTLRSVLQSVARGGEGFKVFTSFNPPQSLNNWCNQYVLDNDPRAIVFHSNYTMVPPEWLGERFIAEAERLKAINETAYRHEYLGEPTGTGGEVFTTLEIRPIPDEEAAQLEYVFVGVDFGFATDPAAVIRLAYDKKHEVIYLLGEIYKRGLSNTELAEAIIEKKWNTTRGEPYYSFFSGGFIYDNAQDITCDAAEPKSIADLKSRGLHVRACSKWPGSVNYGIKWLQRRRIVIDPKRTPNAYKEFVNYEYRKTKDGEYLAEVPDKNNHTIDAVRYALDINIRRQNA